MENGHVAPGELVVGADSHTTTYGALNVASTGIGASEMAYAVATGELWFRVPETIRYEITGQLGRARAFQRRAALCGGQVGHGSGPVQGSGVARRSRRGDEPGGAYDHRQHVGGNRRQVRHL